MTDYLPLNKVTVYITRTDGSDKELLLFRHPTAGLQLPAGTVEDGEDPEAAALREAAEETGLSDLELARLLSVEETVIPSDQRAIRVPSPLYSEPREDAPLLGTIGRSGFLVDAGETVGAFRQVVQHSYKFDGNGFKPVGSITGWALDAHLTQHIVRRHFELRPKSPTPDRWTHLAEGQYDFRLFWLPLCEPIPLVASNQAWLQRVIGVLRA